MTDQFLAGKVALITGGSRGIGRAIALKLAAHGADIVINYARKTTAAEQTRADIESLGRRAIAIKANLADADKISAMFDRIETEFGRCDILVGNAASGIPRPVLETTDKHWDWTLDINARSILRCARRAVPLMAAHGWGRIIAVSSQGSTRVIPNYGITGVSKAAIEALVRYLAVDLAEKGIAVNAISPGVVDTDALKSFPIDVRQTIADTAARTPARRIVTPAEVAALAAFLCTDDAAMIVGQTIVMDGGLGLLV